MNYKSISNKELEKLKRQHYRYKKTIDCWNKSITNGLKDIDVNLAELWTEGEMSLTEIFKHLKLYYLKEI